MSNSRKQEASAPKKWDFQAQLKMGKKGEKLFMRFWDWPIRKNEDIKGVDFIDSEGRRLELKTDAYDMDSTPYFFMEKFSDVKTQSPGGPWQAMQKGATDFIYMFIQNRTWFHFSDLPQLVLRLDELTESAWGINIPNKGWTTQGYKIKRSALEDLYKREEF